MIQKKAARSGRFRIATAACLGLRARLAVLVDGNRPSRWRAELSAVLLTPEFVGHVPIVRTRILRDVLAMLHVLAVAAATNVGTDRRPSDGADTGGDVATTATADLVPEDTADDPADDRARYVRTAFDAFALHPAALFGRADDGAHRRDRRLIEGFARVPAILVRLGRRRRLGRRILGGPVAADRPGRRDAVVQPHAVERRIFAGTKDDAMTLEMCVFAHLPIPALHDGGRRAVVEIGTVEVPHRPIDVELAPVEAFPGVESDLCC